MCLLVGSVPVGGRRRLRRPSAAPADFVVCSVCGAAPGLQRAHPSNKLPTLHSLHKIHKLLTVPCLLEAAHVFVCACVCSGARDLPASWGAEAAAPASSRLLNPLNQVTGCVLSRVAAAQEHGQCVLANVAAGVRRGQRLRGHVHRQSLRRSTWCAGVTPEARFAAMYL